MNEHLRGKTYIAYLTEMVMAGSVSKAGPNNLAGGGSGARRRR